MCFLASPESVVVFIPFMDACPDSGFKKPNRMLIVDNNKSEKELVTKILKYLKQKKRCKKIITTSFKNLKKYDFEKNCNIYYDCIAKYLLN